MFKCEKCNKTTQPREKLHRVPIMFKDVTYQTTRKKGKYETVVTSPGKNIVKEINVCEKCYQKIVRNNHEKEN